MILSFVLAAAWTVVCGSAIVLCIMAKRADNQREQTKWWER